MVTIKNKRPTILGLQNGVRLMPGKNEIPAEVYEANRSIDSFQSWLKLGWITVSVPAKPAAPAPNEPAEPEAADALEGLNVAQAKALIKNTESVAILDAWYIREGRKTLQAAIKARLAELAPEDEDEDVVDLDEPVEAEE